MPFPLRAQYTSTLTLKKVKKKHVGCDCIWHHCPFPSLPAKNAPHIRIPLFCPSLFLLFRWWRRPTYLSFTYWRRTVPPLCQPCVAQTSGASVEEGQLVIGNGPWLVFRARPLACRLVGTTSIRSTRPRPLIDGGRRQESSFLTAELRSQFAASVSQVV